MVFQNPADSEPPKVMAPRQISETNRPVRPSWLYFMAPLRVRGCLHHMVSWTRRVEVSCAADLQKAAKVDRQANGRPLQRLLRMPSTIFLASPNNIMVLSRKKSSFSTPA